MAQIAHPSDDGSIEVEIIDSESHHGNEMVQIEASDDDIKLTDQSGNAPWLFADSVVSDNEWDEFTDGDGPEVL